MNVPAPPGPPSQSDGHDELLRRAQQAGIATTYSGFWGATVEVGDEVLARALASMGPLHDAAAAPTTLVVPLGQPGCVEFAEALSWTLRGVESADALPLASGHGTSAALPPTLAMGIYRLEAGSSVQTILVAPAQCWLPEGLRHGERWWGITAQMYALRSERSWGIGDFTDLAQCIRLATAQGAAFVGVSPLHALRPGQPEAASPYSPSSRLALNVLHIDVTAVPEFLHCEAVQALCAEPGFRARLQAAQESATVDYLAIAALKDAALACLWQTFRQTAWRDEGARGAAFDAFRTRHAPTLGPHARFEAIQCTLQAGDPGIWGWPAWPQALRDPQSPAVQAFLDEHADAVAYRFWLQWLAHDQLAQASATARALMPIGLYCDLAVGAADGGTDTWADQALYARGMNAGAPPDPLSPHGQDWGLPPMNPVALAAAHYLPLQRMLAAVMEPAGAVRMDHVMALMRLFWTSEAGGTYVAYPLEAMLAVLAIESHRHRCMVIGEDLGNVAPRMREAMAEHALLSYRPLIFERLNGGAFRPPAQWPVQALAVVTTHDLPTLAGFWAADDVALHDALGWLDGDARLRAQLDRARDRTHLLAALDAEGLLPEGATLDAQSVPEMTPALAAAVHRYLARTPCHLVGVQLEDLLGQREQPNVPGTTDNVHPNWRRRMAVPLEQLAATPFFAAITAAVHAERDSSWPLAGPIPPLHTADIPRATYRVQLNAQFNFDQALAAVPYLHALGISHLYTSPYLKAGAGSTHGYDMVDPTQINPEIGTPAQHDALCTALADHDMGHLLDTVPNHMGVEDEGNRWWHDVLEHGQASPHAATFDIEWNPEDPHTGQRVLLPVLGDHYGKVLDAGELQVRFDRGTGQFRVAYWERSFPLDPRSYATLLSHAPLPVAVAQGAGLEDLAAMQSLVDAWAQLPPQDTRDPAARAARLRDTALHQQRLADLAARHAWVREWMDANLRQVNGSPGVPSSFDALDQLLQRQAYRLADWRVAGDDINYRRFFNINALAAIRMEEPAVFDAVHALTFRWLAEGKVSGLRIDHPDGLADPAQYFVRLQQRYQQVRNALGLPPRALYVVVEKIMADHEPLPADWPVHGGTGYRFATLVNGLFIDSEAQDRFDAVYTAFTGDILPLDEAARACKRLIIETALFSDLAWLVATLSRITRADRRFCDFTRNQLRVALTEVAAQFPVYRTYVVPGGAPPSVFDVQHLDRALAAAGRSLGTAEGGVLAFLRDVLLGEDGPEPALRARFVQRWQQFTAPVMAKAVEDTLFYRYVRLVSLNDVGAEPHRFGLPVAAFHQGTLQRARHVPHGLLATSTHDSKRSEDVRARLNVLSELADEWHATVQALQSAGEAHQGSVDEAAVPSAHDRWALFQALVGIWPAEGADAASRAALRERIQSYMVKAMREAKQQTNWLFPHQPYEEAVARYIDKALHSEQFRKPLQAFVERIAPYGFRNSLCQLAIKLLAPGVPDIYQGCEHWNFSLVDPDNRRPVDFAALAASLATVSALYAGGNYPSASAWDSLLGCGSNAMPATAKQLVTWRLLQLRARWTQFFRDALYLPLAVEGPAASHAVAFARIHEGRAVVLVCGRLLAGWDARFTNDAAGWTATQVALAEAHPALAKPPHWVNLFTGEHLANGPQLSLAAVLGAIGAGDARLPFAVLGDPSLMQ
ncbi:MAG: malto-oligosyltrehalose synthase [Acidovorax sp.]|uniref:malto-oligosyltrehalose synthase n=1 Tax=Acidovorax sp. TaxID=1872122 RepID=UPI0025C304A1|nr:malto-oligosyltrehalose synthase [Acidovorax sp.]MCE1191579.1 malto-oligosyltrehalose synthase [Acidovorax sp.]